MRGCAEGGHVARLRWARRIWAVASIHGEAARLSRLHDRIASRFGERDAIVYIGNYLGHGGAIGATMRRARSPAKATPCGGGGPDILELAAPFNGFRRVIRGFDRQMRGLVEGEFAVSLDAGAGRGGKLLAAAFAPDGAVLDVVEA